LSLTPFSLRDEDVAAIRANLKQQRTSDGVTA
jgi:hypothetical protein